MFSGCTHTPRCEIDPIPLDSWPPMNFEDDVPEKAYALPNGVDGDGTPYVCSDRERWNDHSNQGRIWTYLHELAHCEGATCEPCADFRAGEILQQSGWDQVEGEDGFLEAIGNTLEFRDPTRAQMAFHRGFSGLGLDRRPLDPSTLNSKSVDFYSPGNPNPIPGTVVEVRNGIWVDILNADDWDSLFTDASNAGIVWTVNSSFRSMDEQIVQWNQRHPFDVWQNNPSANATADAAIVSAIGPAAVPGGSEHQLGRAVDLSFDTDPHYDAFAQMAEGYSIYRDAPTERWHFAWVDPLLYPNGRRKYPLNGINPGNAAAGARTLADASDGTDSGSETNPPGPYLAKAPALQSTGIAFLAIAALIFGMWRYRT